jgi:hypothetical protein
MPTKRKLPLTPDNLRQVQDFYRHSTAHNNRLFVAMLFTEFSALLCLGEMTFSNDTSAHNWWKVTCRSSVQITNEQYKFHLPGHKADRFFKENQIIVRNNFGLNPLAIFNSYIASQDTLHPVASALWLTASGRPPTRSFFINRLRQFFGPEIAGQSMRAGGATALAELGVALSIIQAAGHWASEAFLIYVHKNPSLMQSMLFTQARAATHVSLLLFNHHLRQLDHYFLFLFSMFLFLHFIFTLFSIIYFLNLLISSLSSLIFLIFFF